MNILNDIEILSVSQFTQQFKFLLDREFFDIWISGEISNFKDHSSGHAYFSLKDDQSMIKACLFKPFRSKIKFELEDGLKVTAHGRIDVYNKRGEYQIIVDHLIPEGVGALQLAFEQLKSRLEKEGLFDSKHKVPIPAYPERVGIVTSPTGAAIRDILNIMNRRFSAVDIFIYPAQVQGDSAGEDIAKKIDIANKMNLVDALIVGRGGGSAEDLWAFNEEVVARAIFNSKIPIISAVGHEIDFTIADFVADLRAPTPSAAAELVVESQDSLINFIDQSFERLNVSLTRLMTFFRDRLSRFSPDVLTRIFSQQLTQYRIHCDRLSQDLSKNMQNRLNANLARFNLASQKLSTLGPASILKRGYSLVYLVEGNQKKLVTKTKDLKPNDLLEIQFQEGKIKARVE